MMVSCLDRRPVNHQADTLTTIRTSGQFTAACFWHVGGNPGRHKENIQTFLRIRNPEPLETLQKNEFYLRVINFNIPLNAFAAYSERLDIFAEEVVHHILRQQCFQLVDVTLREELGMAHHLHTETHRFCVKFVLWAQDCTLEVS